MRESSVVRFIPRRSAAPSAPATRQPLVVPARVLRWVPPRVNAATRLVGLRAYAASRMAAILRDDAHKGGAAPD